MPLPDKYADEPIVEVPPDRVAAWRNAEDAADRWRKYADELKRGLIEEFGASHALVVNGEKVITYRPSDAYAVSRLEKDYPDLTAHYLREETRSVLDLSAMRQQHEDIVEKYRIRPFRYVGD